MSIWINSKLISLLLFLVFLISSDSAYAQIEQYMKNEDIKTTSERIGDKVYFTFGFKDTNGKYREWKWNDNSQKIETLSKAFGIYNQNVELEGYDPTTIDQYHFREHPLFGLVPNYTSLVEKFKSSVLPLYTNWKKFTLTNNLNKRESVELLLRFLQDFPYGVPPMTYERNYIAGLFVAPLIFKNGWADCDSKSLLMLTVLSNDPYFKDKIAMILVPGHALIGISMQPFPYDETYSYRNKKYIVAEPTGLARTPFGQKNSPYKKTLYIEPINLIENIDYEKEDQIKENIDNNKGLTDADCEDNGLLIDYISYDNKRVQMCQIKQDDKYIKHGYEIIYDINNKPIKKNKYFKGELTQSIDL